MKKNKILIVLMLSFFFFLTGCGTTDIYSSPESIAKEMAKRMSKGEYSKVSELLLNGDKAFIDSSSFENYLNENSLNIVGNKKYEVVKEDNTTENTTSKYVKIRIDDNKILKVYTVKDNNKWYVNIGDSYFDKDLIIKVPTGATVKLNGVQLNSKKYATTELTDRSWANGNKGYDYQQSEDVYTIPTILKGKYTLEVTHNDINTINEEIYSNKRYYNNYMRNNSNTFNTNDDFYNVFVKATDKDTTEIKKFVEEYFANMYKAGSEGKDFKEVSNYFNSKNTTLFTTYESSYNKLKNQFVDNSYSTWTTIISDVKLDFSYDDKYYGVNYVNDGRYIILCKYTANYKATKKYIAKYYGNKEDTTSNEKITKQIILDITKNKDGSFVISDGVRVIPSFKTYE